jgi:DNA-binding response OmpR family regulator
LQNDRRAHERPTVEGPLTMAHDSSPLILIVEDDRDSREMYASYLMYCGFRTAEAGDIESGFDRAVHLQPAVVVTDYVLGPKGSGDDLCQQLNADERTRDIPTLMLTGLGKVSADPIMRGGCATVRVKPYPPDELVADIEALIRGELRA